MCLIRQRPESFKPLWVVSKLVYPPYRFLSEFFFDYHYRVNSAMQQHRYIRRDKLVVITLFMALLLSEAPMYIERPVSLHDADKTLIQASPFSTDGESITHEIRVNRAEAGTHHNLHSYLPGSKQAFSITTCRSRNTRVSAPSVIAASSPSYLKTGALRI